MNTLIIHIGTTKTGTSAIQKFLYDNREIILKTGYDYVDMATLMKDSGVKIYAEGNSIYKNGVVLNLFVDKEQKLNTKKNEKAWEIFIRILKEKLQKNSVILSEETIWSWDTVDILEVIKKEIEDVKIIVYLRRQDKYMESSWNQIVKRQRYYTGTFEDVCEDRKDYRPYKYLDKLNEIEQLCGLDNMIVRAYDKEFFEGERNDLISDFLFSIGVELDYEECIYSTGINESLTGNMVEIKRVMNYELASRGYLGWKFENRFLNMICEMNAKMNGKVSSVESYLSNENRANIISKYHDENAIIAKRYLKRKDGVLFNEDIKLDEGGDRKDIYEDIIRLFTNMYLEQEKKINVCKWTNIELTYRSRGKKIAFLGAGDNCRILMKYYNATCDIILDNNKTLIDEKINGVKIVYAKEFTDWDKYIIVITCSNYGELEQYIKGLGLVEFQDYLIATKYIMN